MGANGSSVCTSAFEKPVRHLSGDTAKAGGYSRVESSAEIQTRDINWQGSSSIWLESEL